MKKLIVSTLLMLSQAVFATDANSYKNLGFSADGRYYAFVQSVIQDGSGFPSAMGQVIDVARNQTVEYKHVVIQDDMATEKSAVDQVLAQINARHYGIDGRNMGDTLWVRLETDLSPATRQAEFSNVYNVEGGSSSVWPKLRLNITERAAPKPEQECFGGEDSRMITLSLTDLQSNSRRDLQVDNRVPASRQCAWGYQLRQVLSYKGSVVASVRYLTFGFEGPDYNYMVVTGANAIH